MNFAALKRTSYVLAGVIGLVASACGSTARSAPPATIPSATVAVAAALPNTPQSMLSDGEWVTVEPEFEIGEYGTSIEGPSADISMVTSAAGAYWALGDIDGKATIWRADDPDNFRVVYNDADIEPSRHIRLTHLVEFGATIVAGGPGRVNGGAEELERSFLLASTDNGVTWAEIDTPVLSDPFQRLDQLLVVGDQLLIDVVNDECCAQPDWTSVRTADLVSWIPIELPEAEADSWPYLVTDQGGTVWAIEERWDNAFKRIVWTSTDNGVTWDREATSPPDTDNFGSIGVNGVLIIVDALGDSVRPAPDVGQWGDGPIRLSGINDPTTGRFYGVLNRTIRANPHYCFEDITTCIETQRALVTSADGVEWRDIITDPGLFIDRDGLFINPDGHIAIFWQSRNDLGKRSPQITVWTGDLVPSTVDPAAYPLAAEAIAFFDYEEGLAVGMQRRYAWGLGDCGAMYIDGQTWVPVDEPDTSNWPIRTVQIEDGPSAFAYGRVERLADDVIEFSVEQTDIKVTLMPRLTELAYSCG